MTQHPAGRRGRVSSGPCAPQIAVDLLGGDNAPAVVVEGALRACRTDPQLQLLLVGPSEVADEVMGALPGHAKARVRALNVDRGVGMSDPVAHGADARTSIGAALLALASQRVDAVVSAGASGATVAAAVVAVGRMSGVRRPALAAILPGRDGPLVLLDVGAGLDVNPVDLVHHAALGAGYARLAAGVRSPRVGLLSVGSEPGKGDRLRRAADAALRAHVLPEATYVGLVEGGEVITGTRADVVVTDGFTGNVLLKGIEAALGLALAPALAMSVPRAAALLGVAGTVVVCHGVASGADLASGMALAARLVRARVMVDLASATGLVDDSSGRNAMGRGSTECDSTECDSTERDSTEGDDDTECDGTGPGGCGMGASDDAGADARDAQSGRATLAEVPT